MQAASRAAARRSDRRRVGRRAAARAVQWRRVVEDEAARLPANTAKFASACATRLVVGRVDGRREQMQVGSPELTIVGRGRSKVACLRQRVHQEVLLVVSRELVEIMVIVATRGESIESPDCNDEQQRRRRRQLSHRGARRRDQCRPSTCSSFVLMLD